MKPKNLKHLTAVLAVMLGVYLAASCILLPAIHKEAQPQPMERLQPRDCGERVRCIDDNREALIRRLQIMESAREELIFTSYNFQTDESGRDMMAAMLHAADRGVRVRVLVDGFCAFTNLNSSRQFQAFAAADNVEVRIYNPISLLHVWRINYRMHDKYVVADDTVYLLGGRNTHNLSLGDYQDKADIDRDVLVYASRPDPAGSVHQVTEYFETSWNLPTTRRCAGRENPEELSKLRDYYDYMHRGAPELLTVPDWKTETVETTGVTLIHNPQQARNKAPILWKNLVSLMETGAEVTVQTPYIVCNRMMYDDLARLQTGGTEMKLITNAVETGANPNGCADYLNQKKHILGTGATIYEYAGDHSSHTKTILIDDTTSIIGSFNLDMRSAYLDTEMMLVIRSPELNAHLRQMNDAYMSASRMVLPDGTEYSGESYEAPAMPVVKQILYTLMRVILPPVRHLL